MDGRGSAAILSVVLSVCLLIAACAHAAAAGTKDSAITVTGNRQVGADTIRAYFHPAGGKLDAAALDAVKPALELMSSYALEMKIIPRRYSVEELFDDTTRALQG